MVIREWLRIQEPNYKARGSGNCHSSMVANPRAELYGARKWKLSFVDGCQSKSRIISRGNV
jgi:hypothetical protein